MGERSSGDLLALAVVALGLAVACLVMPGLRGSTDVPSNPFAQSGPRAVLKPELLAQVRALKGRERIELLAGDDDRVDAGQLWVFVRAALVAQHVGQDPPASAREGAIWLDWPDHMQVFVDGEWVTVWFEGVKQSDNTN